MKAILVFLSLVLASCATTLPHEPTGDHDTLVVGEISLHAEHFNQFGAATVNGDHSAGIIVTVLQVDSDKEFTVVTVGDRGLFSFPAVVGVEYQIIKLDYTNQSGGATAQLVGTPDRLRFRAPADGVSSLGAIVWSADDKRRYYAKTGANPAHDVKADVLKQYPKTKWIDAPWASVTWIN